ALPAKFAETIIEAIGRAPERPAHYIGLEARPQRFEALPANGEAVKAFIASHVVAQ
ncbi:MAG TPA: threonine synthase, partial [Burkholderiaceae bacterium]|nr:threonine synthase [Burkholderiaceae bacterium]